jgi:hypothetical protein
MGCAMVLVEMGKGSLFDGQLHFLGAGEKIFGSVTISGTTMHNLY